MIAESERTVLIVSQTVSLPDRRRTWQQARALASAGWRVRILCPRTPGQSRREIIDGIRIRRFAQPYEGNGKPGILLEYLLALFIVTGHLAGERLRTRIDAVQVVNPPDWLVLPMLLLRLAGARVVFDMADRSTALFEAKFGRDRFFFPLLRCLSAIALRTPDLVVTANETYLRIAIAEGRRDRSNTIAVHSYPDRLPELRERTPGRIRIGYFGVLGSHDGVDRLIDAALLLDDQKFEIMIVGDGPAMLALRRRVESAGLASVDFVGFLSGAERDAAIASFDIGVIPDPVNRYTRSICQNKAFVYAAHGLAVVSTPLPGTRRILPCAMYAEDDSPAALAQCLGLLLRESPMRDKLGRAARQHAQTAFDWPADAACYVQAMNALVLRARTLGRAVSR